MFVIADSITHLPDFYLSLTHYLRRVVVISPKAKLFKHWVFWFDEIPVSCSCTMLHAEIFLKNAVQPAKPSKLLKMKDEFQLSCKACKSYLHAQSRSGIPHGCIIAPGLAGLQVGGKGSAAKDIQRCCWSQGEVWVGGGVFLKAKCFTFFLSVVQLFRDNVNPFLLDQAGTDKVPKAAC